MLALLCALGTLLIALVIGLGRQVTVFSAFEPGLWLFRGYRKKRLVGLGLVVALSTAALLTRSGLEVLVLVGAAWALLAFAFLFNLERLFPALHTVRVASAEGSDLGAGARVLVLELGGERRAYPLEQMVMPRHLIHDVVGGVPIVVTYCALCRTGLVFRAEHGGERLFFAVVGVFRRNLIMEDHLTNTLWQQATGEAIFGPLAGKTLELLPAVQMPWQQAQQRNGMTLAVEPEGAPFAVLATRRGFGLLEWVTEHVMMPGHTRLSNALPRRETVFGVQVNGKAKAYPLSEVRSSGPFSDTVGGVELEIEFDEPAEVLRVRRCDGEPDPIVEKHWWLGWNEFHPDTEAFRFLDAFADVLDYQTGPVVLHNDFHPKNILLHRGIFRE
jgi:hypothetical protein